ncbi:porin [Neorhizobium alkalisoli]
MMGIKGLFLGSAAALAAFSGANAADAIVAAEPEPMEYVRVCDAFGTGYFYIPGTETCLKVGGRVRFDVKVGNAYAFKGDGLFTNLRSEIYTSSASDTEWGALKTNMTARFEYNPRYDVSTLDSNNTRTRLMVATIEFGGFTVGLQDSMFETFTYYAGNVANDDVIDYGPSEVAMIAYSYKADNGFAAFLALEDDGQIKSDGGSASDWPNVAGGIKYDDGTYLAALAAGYDESAEEAVIKARIGGKFGPLSVFLMGAWNTDGDIPNSYAPASRYGTSSTPVGWGDWAVWGGGAYKFTDKLTGNLQVAYTDSKILAATANVQWSPAAGFFIAPELGYTSWDNAIGDGDQWSGMVRFQRTF